MYTCRFCGGRIIFRMGRKDPSGTYVVYRRPFPIHVDGDRCSRPR